MLDIIPFHATKALPRPALRSPRSTGGRLAKLRDDIAVMRPIDFDTIARLLDIMPEDVRALGPKTNKQDRSCRLTRHAIHALLKGRHAHLGGRTRSMRARNLIRIASAYSRQELLEEAGIGAVTAMEIQLWLEKRGVHLRDATDQ